MNPPVGTRRPIKARDSRWAAKTASFLASTGIRPNTISVLSVVFAAAAGACLASTPRFSPGAAAVLFVCGALGVQCRLLCNLFDGMVAVEGGRRSKSGEVFNELPDRLADALILLGFGFAAAALPYGVTLGWSAALLAVITAYVRTLGAATGAGQNFTGPMAKPHRMAVVTSASLVAAVAGFWNFAPQVVYLALIIIVLGTIVTIVRRTSWVIRTLEAK